MYIDIHRMYTDSFYIYIPDGPGEVRTGGTAGELLSPPGGMDLAVGHPRAPAFASRPRFVPSPGRCWPQQGLAQPLCTSPPQLINLLGCPGAMGVLLRGYWWGGGNKGAGGFE